MLDLNHKVLSEEKWWVEDFKRFCPLDDTAWGSDRMVNLDQVLLSFDTLVVKVELSYQAKILSAVVRQARLLFEQFN